MGIGGLLYLLCAIVYLVLPEKHTLQGWTLFGYLLSMALTFAFLCFNKVRDIGHWVDTSRYLSLCSFVGIIGHFIVISGFTWMTIVGFDTWSAFRRMRVGRASFKPFWQIYVPVSISYPLLVVLVSVVLDFLLK